MRPPNLLANTTNVVSTSSSSKTMLDKPAVSVSSESTPADVLAKYLVPSTAFADNFNVEHDLGKGRFAVVRHCRCRQSGDEFAAKVLRKARLHLSRDAILQEIFIHHRATRVHSRVAKLARVFEAPRELILVMEYAAGGELWHALSASASGIHEPVVRRVTAQLLDVLSFVHASGIVHCDINPHNILLSQPYFDHPDYQPDIRLCDFGLARLVTSGQDTRDIRGTLEYVAPEVLLFDPIGTWSDIWSVGVLTYVLLSGFSPFAGSTKEETLLNISAPGADPCQGLFDEDSDDERVENDSTGQLDSDGDSSSDGGAEKLTTAWATPVIRDFIRNLLVKSPKKRPSAAECLRQAWLREVSVTTQKPHSKQTAAKAEESSE